MPAGCGGDGDVFEAGLCVDEEVGDEELLGVDGVVERETRQLDVAAEENPARGSIPDGPDVELGDERAGQGLRRLDEGREELEDGEARLLGHGFDVGGFDYESGSVHA